MLNMYKKSLIYLYLTKNVRSVFHKPSFTQKGYFLHKQFNYSPNSVKHYTIEKLIAHIITKIKFSNINCNALINICDSILSSKSSIKYITVFDNLYPRIISNMRAYLILDHHTVYKYYRI